MVLKTDATAIERHGQKCISLGRQQRTIFPRAKIVEIGVLSGFFNDVETGTLTMVKMVINGIHWLSMYIHQ